MSILTARPFLVCPRCGARHSGAVVPGQRTISATCADCARLSRRATVTHRRVPRSWPALLAVVTRWGLWIAAWLAASALITCLLAVWRWLGTYALLMTLGGS